MLPPLADIEALEDRLGEEVANESSAESLLAYASSLVRAEAGRNWVDAQGELDGVPDGIEGVVVGMVERATRNPASALAEQDTTGPFTTTRTWGPEAAQRVYLTAGDRTILRAALGRPALWTLSTTRGDVEAGTIYAPVAGGGEPFPMLSEDPW